MELSRLQTTRFEATGFQPVEASLLEYLKRYDSASEKLATVIENLVKKAMNYYRDFILPNKKYLTPNKEEKKMLKSYVVISLNMRAMMKTTFKLYHLM